MEVYLVGGAVRDLLLGIEPKDKDYVVVGATEQELIWGEYKRVGADFPVFLHPDTGEEYALARTERSTGKGYHDFEVVTDNVTLEEDLARRDLTINSIALDLKTNSVVDPYGGQQDLRDGILRHTTDAFVEDPLRVFRIARFAARFPHFKIHRDTVELAKKIVDDGLVHHLTSERVGKELEKALAETKPSRFFQVLDLFGALDIWFPEIKDLQGQTQPEKWHAEGDSYVHTLLVLDASTRSKDVLVRWGALVHDLGKGVTPKDALPAHHGHEQAGVPRVATLVSRLRLGNRWLKIGQKVAKYHTHVHKVFELNPKTFSKVLDDIGDNITHTRIIASVAEFDGLGKIPAVYNPKNGKAFVEILEKIALVKAKTVLTDDEIENYNKQKKFGAIKDAIRRGRIQTAKNILNRYKGV